MTMAGLRMGLNAYRAEGYFEHGGSESAPDNATRPDRPSHWRNRTACSQLVLADHRTHHLYREPTDHLPQHPARAPQPESSAAKARRWLIVQANPHERTSNWQCNHKCYFRDDGTPTGATVCACRVSGAPPARNSPPPYLPAPSHRAKGVPDMRFGRPNK